MEHLDFNKQFIKWKQGRMKPYECFVLGKPSSILLEAGIPNLTIIMQQSMIKKVTEKIHKLSIDELMKIPKEIQEPLMIMEGTKENSFVLLTELREEEKPVIVALHINAIHNRQKVNRIASIYGRDGFKEYINRQLKDNKIIYVDKNRSLWFTRSELQLSTLVQTIASRNNISSQSKKVNEKNEKQSIHSKLKTFQNEVDKKEHTREFDS